MRVKCEDDSTAILRRCEIECAGDHGAVPEMHAIEDPGGNGDWAGECRKIGDGGQVVHVEGLGLPQSEGFAFTPREEC